MFWMVYSFLVFLLKMLLIKVLHLKHLFKIQFDIEKATPASNQTYSKKHCAFSLADPSAWAELPENNPQNKLIFVFQNFPQNSPLP